VCEREREREREREGDRERERGETIFDLLLEQSKRLNWIGLSNKRYRRRKTHSMHFFLLKKNQRKYNKE